MEVLLTSPVGAIISPMVPELHLNPSKQYQRMDYNFNLPSCHYFMIIQQPSLNCSRVSGADGQTCCSNPHHSCLCIYQLFTRQLQPVIQAAESLFPPCVFRDFFQQVAIVTPNDLCKWATRNLTAFNDNRF